MPRRITVQPHLTVEQLFERHRKERDPVAVRRFQVVWLAAQGKSSKQIVEATGYRRDWVFEIIKRYNEGGPDALADKRKHNGGHGRIISDAQLAVLARRLEHPPPDGGLWTSPKVAAWVNEEFGLDIDFKLAWDYLKRMGFSLRRPRPAHVRADKKAQRAFKRGGLRRRVRELLARGDVPRLTVWAQDEARIGLKPVLRRTWARRGSRPVARQHPRYQWLYVYTFVRPDTGDTFWLLLPTVSAEAFSIALREFAEAVGVGPDHHVLLVLDRAGWHTTAKLDVPEGIHLEFLPPYSPELMPAERLWPVLREAVANRPVHNLDQLEARLTFRIKTLRRNPAFIAGLTGYRWWMDALRPIV